MRCTIVLLILICFTGGCTRYGTNQTSGPFSRRLNSNTDTPPAPPANNSPLVLGAPVAPSQTDLTENPIVPPRPTDVEGVKPAAGTAPANTPAAPSTAAINIAEIKKLAAFSAAKWAQIDTYEAVVTRRELTPNKEMSEDVVLFQYRKQPMSVFVRTIGESGKGRELIYNSRTDKIHVMLGEGDLKLLPAGFKVPAVTPDDPRVKERSRYSIRDAGIGTPISRVGSWVAKAEAGKIPPDALTYLGPVQRKEYPYPIFGASLKMRPGDDPVMPAGGIRQWFFDPRQDSGSYGLPVLIVATEPSGREVEYYLFEKVKLQVKLTDADFAPERLGKK
jgi:hypothetical protein